MRLSARGNGPWRTVVDGGGRCRTLILLEGGGGRQAVVRRKKQCRRRNGSRELSVITLPIRIDAKTYIFTIAAVFSTSTTTCPRLYY